MNLNVLLRGARFVIKRGGLLLRKFGPKIMTGAGIAGFGVSCYMTGKATLKAADILQDRDDQLAEIEDRRENCTEQEYPKAEYEKDKKTVKKKTRWKLVKNFAAPGAVFIASSCSVAGGLKIVSTRLAGAVATVNTLAADSKFYRDNVIKEFGTDVDYRMRHGITKECLEEAKEKLAEERKQNGTENATNEKAVSTTRRVQYNSDGKYKALFCEYCHGWVPDGRANLSFLQLQEQHMNDKLRENGHLFLNEVYDALGIEHTKEGSICGWVIDKGCHNYVDFGLHNLSDPDLRRFAAGKEANVWLDFNCDGIIWDLI